MSRPAIVTKEEDRERYRELRDQVGDIPLATFAGQLGISVATLYGRLQGSRPVTHEAVLAMESLVASITHQRGRG
jgi:hypothetical protein